MGSPNSAFEACRDKSAAPSSRVVQDLGAVCGETHRDVKPKGQEDHLGNQNGLRRILPK